MSKCATPRCRNQRVKGKTLCHTCRSRKYRQSNPVKAAYDALKHNARRRGKTFSLTLDEFKKFCRKTKYIAGKGRAKDHYSIDRIDNNRWYEIGNIRVLTNQENAAKGKKLLMYDWQTKYATVI